VLDITDKLAPQPPRPTQDIPIEPTDGDEDEEMQEEMPEEVKIAEQIGTFDEVVVWGHGGMVDEGSDMFVRSVREWVGFAESMHCDEEGEGEANEAKTL
jgi:ribonuclease H2 subunit C